MSVLLYAVTESDIPVSGEGLGGSPLRALKHAGLTAVVSEHEQTPPVSENNLWEYEHVVEQLMSLATILPARFGAVADGDDEVKKMLSDRKKELKSTLEEVDGAVEIAIRAPASNEPVSRSVQSGTEYMQAHLAERRRAQDLMRKVELAVGSLARAKKQPPHSDNRVAYLVDYDRVEQFIAQLEQLERPEIAWTGPWPPYSFVQPYARAS